MPRNRTQLYLALVGLVSFTMPIRAQIPQEFRNLQYFPKDIPRDTLIQVMRGFSFALGVRCQYCHAGGDGVSFEGVMFASDEKPAKRKARYMLRMRDSINLKLLAGLPDRSDPAISVSCVTCHRKLAKPATLEQTLATTIGSAGVDSAVAQYRGLRQNALVSGTYDFSEWSMNELAHHLADRGKTAEAIVILQLNQEFYPNSAEIDLLLADLYYGRGEREKAIAYYRAVLVKSPSNQRAKRRLTELGVSP